MASNAKANTKHSSSEHAHTSNLLSDIWHIWVTDFGHSPATAKKKMTAKIKAFHKDETRAVKRKIKKTVKKAKSGVKSATKHKTKKR